MDNKPAFVDKPVAVWAQDDGSVKVQVRKRYKAKDGSFKNTDVYFGNELETLIASLTNALNWIKANRPESLEKRKRGDDGKKEPEVEYKSRAPFNPDTY